MIHMRFVRLRELVWVGGCVTAPVAWASGPSALASRGHGTVDVVGPVAPPGRESGRGYAGVYTDRREWPLGATTARMQNAPFGEAHTQSALFRDAAGLECALWSRRGGVAGAECVFA